MRTVSTYITELWKKGGPFIGPDRAHARVTVEPDWQLRVESNVVASKPSKLPFRWWQRFDNSQFEVEVPNIKSISWDRSIDADAASCNISIYNQKMDPNLTGQNVRLGTRGYYTWRNRNGSGGSDSVNARALWPENLGSDWIDILIPNALLRTYQGYGGHGKTIPDAVEDGNLLLSGVWLVDRVDVGSDGMLTLQCRDMCKLLIEQMLYLPFMPAGMYPLKYRRWIYESLMIPAVPYYDRTDPTTPLGPYFGPGSEGRKWVPDFGISSDDEGYWILGTDGGVFSYDVPFWGSRGMGAVGTTPAITARPQGDGYWVASENGNVFALGAALNFGSPSMLVGKIVDIVATSTGLGYWLLGEDGIVYNFGDAVDHGEFPLTTSLLTAMAARSDNNGYWLVAEDGAIYAFGTAPYHGNAAVGAAKAVGIAARAQNDGYWIVASDGAVFAKGAATYYGGANTIPGAAPIIDIVATSTGLGYWLLAENGGVFTFGDADFHGASPPTTARMLSLDASDDGYWLLAENGTVYAFDEGYFGNPAGGVDQAPMRGFDVDPLGRGYWMASEDGAVFALGETSYYGGANATVLNAPVIRLAAHPDGRGYWLLGADGGVFNFGSADFFGSAVGTVVGAAVDMAITPTGEGYWILGEGGHIYSFGDATYYGNATPIASGDKAVAMAARPQGDGYWIVTEKGEIFGKGAAVAWPAMVSNGDWPAAKAALSDPITAVDVVSTGDGILLAAGDGGIFSFGTAPFEGSLPGPFQKTWRYPGEYEDLTDIIKDLLLWAGWLLYGTNFVYGNLESTGTYIEDEIPADTFDKKAVIDAINVIRDIVGYEFWVDEEGGAHFESPNWYTYGNFMQETGLRTGAIPEINEKTTLTSYSTSYVDAPVRSEIIITSADPTLGGETTITTRRPWHREVDADTRLPIEPDLLRGMVRPAMLPVPIKVNRAEQEMMAELIEQHAHYQLLQGQLSCVAYPAIQVNDQVRIIEQVTGETDVHFIRGVASNHDLDTGQWTFDITTNRLGPGRTKAIGGATISARPPEVARPA
jgi:hypothetical protein